MTDPDPVQEARPRRRTRGARRRKRWHAARVLAYLLTLPVVFGLMAVVMMFDRDITAPGWVTDQVAARARGLLGGGSVEFGQIAVRLGPDLHPRVRLIDTVLADADGRPLARIAEIDATVSPRGLLFDRTALVQHVALRGTAVALIRDAQGRLQLAFNLPDGDRGALLADGLPGLVRQLDTLRDRPALAALESLTLAGLDLTYVDARADRRWTATDGGFQLAIDADRTTASADLAVDGAAGQTRLALALDSPRDSLAARLSVRVDGAEARDLASQSAALRFLGALDAPLSATLDTALDPDGMLGPLQATLQVGAGALQPAPGTVPLRFQELTAALTYDPAGQELTFDDVTVVSDWGRLHASGQALARDFRRGLPEALVGQLTLDRIALTPGDLYPAPVTIDRAAIDLRLRLDPFRLDVGQVTISDPNLRLSVAGHLTATPQGWEAAIDATSPRLATRDVLRLWPERLRPGTRKWFAENLLAGQMREVTGGWRMAPGQKMRIAAGFAFDGASARFLKQEPPITGGAGYATLSDGAFVLRLDQGQVIAPQGGALDVAGSVLQIPDVTIKNAPMVLDIATAGSITGTLSILDQPPFRYLSKANLPVTLADGRAAVAAHVELPLKRPIRPDDVTFDATARLSRVRSDTLVKGRSLAASDLAVTVDRGGLQVSGDATLDGVPVRGDFSQMFGPGADPTQVAGQVTITPDALDRFGIALPPGSVTGSGPGELTVTLPKGEAPRFALTSTLEGLGLAVPAIGWSKARGTAGRLEVSGTLGARPSVDSLRLRAPGLQASGTVSLTDAGQLEAASFSDVSVGDWFNGPVTLRGRGKGRTVGVEVRGGTFDLAKADLGGGGAGAGGGTGEGAPILVQLDRLKISDALALRNFAGNFNTTGGFNGTFTGLFNGQAGVAGAVSPSGGRTAVRIHSEDAGAVLRAGPFLDGALGGTLDLTLFPAAAAGSFDGTLALRGLRVRDAPAIAELLDAISVVGLLQQLDGQGLAFDTVDAAFRLTPQQVIVTESSAVGPGLGISLDGIYTLASRAVDFQGVISPVYILNGIGSLLTRRGEGLLGFNFTLRGTPGAPQVSVNPLSIFTPGMFREIFRRPPPVVTN